MKQEAGIGEHTASAAMPPDVVPYRLQRQRPMPEEAFGPRKDFPLRQSCERQMSGEHSPTSVTCASSAFDSDSSDTEHDHGFESQGNAGKSSSPSSLPHDTVPAKPLLLSVDTDSTEGTHSTEEAAHRSSRCLTPPPQWVTERPRLQRKAKSWGPEFEQKLKPYAPLSMSEWERAFETGPSGTRCLRNGGLDVIRRVRLGGCEGSVRAEVWPFLLGLYAFASTAEEREAERERREAGFEELCRQARLVSRCAQIAESQQACPSWEELVGRLPEAFRGPPREGDGGLGAFIVWRKTMRLDAVRVNDQWVPHSSQGVPDADRVLRMLQEAGLEDWEHLSLEQQLHAVRLVRLLEAYAVYDPLIGYCQGMTDLLSPFVALLDDDCDAFGCFAKFMESARHNFRTDEVGIRRQLDSVSQILAACEPRLYRHLTSVGAQDCLFAYRMVLVLLRRELSFEDTVSLWEVLWAEAAAAAASEASAAPAASASSCPSSPSTPRASSLGSMGPAKTDFFLYTVAAVIVSQRKAILECEELDEVLCSFTSLAGKIDAWEVIGVARGLVSLATWRAKK